MVFRKEELATKTEGGEHIFKLQAMGQMGWDKQMKNICTKDSGDTDDSKSRREQQIFPITGMSLKCC